MEADIRPAVIEDAHRLTSLLRAIGWFSHMEQETVGETTEIVKRQLALCLSDHSHSVLVACENCLANQEGAILGYASVHWLPYLIHTGPEGYISELFVAEAARGYGIGAALLEAVRTEALQRSCARLRLLNMRYRESYQRGFYLKHGWEEQPDAATFVYYL